MKKQDEQIEDEGPEDALLNSLRALESMDRSGGGQNDRCELFPDAFSRECRLWDLEEDLLSSDEEDRLWDHFEACSPCRRAMIGIQIGRQAAELETPRKEPRLERTNRSKVESGAPPGGNATSGWVSRFFPRGARNVGLQAAVALCLLLAIAGIWNGLRNRRPIELTARILSPVRALSGTGIGDTVLYSGESFRIQCSVNADSYLYVFSHDSLGRAAVLFPDPVMDEKNRLEKDKRYVLPAEERWFLGRHKGEETLYVLASRKPLKDPEETAAKLQQAGGRLTAVGSDADGGQGTIDPNVFEVSGTLKVLKIHHR